KVINSKLKTPYQNFVIAPLLKLSLLRNIDPKALTFLSLFFGLLIPFFLPLGLPTLSLLCLALSGFFDTVDGALARHVGKTSPQGAVLDITSDRVVEFMIVLGLYLVNPGGRSLLCLLMLGSILFCITTFLVVGIFSKNTTEKSFYYSPGIIERAEAFAFFALMMIFPAAFIPLALIFTFLVILTGIIRIYQFNSAINLLQRSQRKI
ncbi:MAG: hypothetical protein K1000chlam3_01484, partial [Chlamydiae bacterium]|nr:hypothetical protein [Chlamydiota bacterium]